MTLSAVWALVVGAKDQISIIGIVIVILLSLVQVSKINWNPWDRILGWIGDKLNSNMKAQLNRVEKRLNEHISESEAKELKETRRDILAFCNSCMNGQGHTKEQFDFVIKECDDYESYIVEHKIKNGVVSSAIEEIRRLYQKGIRENSFLVEGEQ